MRKSELKNYFISRTTHDTITCGVSKDNLKTKNNIYKL